MTFKTTGKKLWKYDVGFLGEGAWAVKNYSLICPHSRDLVQWVHTSK